MTETPENNLHIDKVGIPPDTKTDLLVVNEGNPDEPMGKLIWKDNKFTFEGDADASAKRFIKFVQENWDQELTATKDLMIKNAADADEKIESLQKQLEEVREWLKPLKEGVESDHEKETDQFKNWVWSYVDKLHKLLTPTQTPPESTKDTE